MVYEMNHIGTADMTWPRGHGFKPRWSPEFFRLLYAIVKIAFITAKIIASLKQPLNLNLERPLHLSLQMKSRRLWNFVWYRSFWFSFVFLSPTQIISSHNNLKRKRCLDEQGWRSGESTRLPPIWPWFDSQTWRNMWVELVVSALCSERNLPGTMVFLSP